MKAEELYYRIYPRIVLSGAETAVHIKPLYGHCSFKEDASYKITRIPMEYGEEEYRNAPGVDVLPENGILIFRDVFEKEQEHRLILWETSGEEKTCLGTFSVYSAEEDLYRLRPYKGDLHMHSCRSDGVESPAYVAAACRKIGLDFMALTDHGRYTPSIEAQEAFKNVRTSLRIFRGEEVHPPENPVHIINFGGSFSVNALFETQQYFDEVKKLEEELEDAPAGVNRSHYASCAWCYDKIREGGGLSLFCHPYWVHENRYNVSSALIDYLFEKQPFDAFELLGGYSLREADSNTLQVACYNEQRSNGKKIPVVGVSDAHGCEVNELFGWYYTIVFSKSLELQDLTGGIRGLHSVAVEALPGQPPKVYGPLRLVKYALFLLAHVFPGHDEKCLVEGKLMLDYITGYEHAAELLQELQNSHEKQFESNWTGHTGA